MSQESTVLGGALHPYHVTQAATVIETSSMIRLDSVLQATTAVATALQVTLTSL